MRLRTIAILFILLAASRPGFAQQRPLVTEDPETVGSGLILIEGGVEYQEDLFYPVSGLTGNLLRIGTLGVSFGISSIAELQIDGGIIQRLTVTDQRAGAAFQRADVHGQSHQRL